MVHERRVVGVVGSLQEEHRAQARLLGRLLADRGMDLLTGGRGGAARSVAEAFVSEPERRGLSLALCPGTVDAAGHHPHPGCPNAFIELALHTHLPAVGEREGGPDGSTLLLVLSARALVVLPGEEETRAAALLAARHGRPALLFGPPQAFAGYPVTLERTEGLARVSDFLLEVLPPQGAPG